MNNDGAPWFVLRSCEPGQPRARKAAWRPGQVATHLERERGIQVQLPRAAAVVLAGTVLGGALIVLSLMFAGRLGLVLWLGGFWAAAGCAIGWLIIMHENRGPS